MANSLDNVPVLVSRKRYLAGQTAINSFRSNFFILDDGFQHIHLKRDMDILLADAKNPFGNGHLLPWGPLREPLSGLKRADAILLTRAKNILPEKHRQYFFNKPVFTGDHIPARIYFPFNEKEEELSYLEGKRVMAFSGIAKPASFKESLLNLGANIISFRIFGDHYPFNRKVIEELQKEQAALNAEVLITTEKDWARIQGIAMDIKSLAFLTINFVITSGKYELLKMVKEKADYVLDRFA
jgi:tetraacyldisaccharide 4'-kinase